ncbi:asparaginase domain-containing protein [Neisseria bacilliformis]|uniref:asparaginase domain-containing protein n=1 Tax=Neisseria bacilliformis TaxID=267212 RepID=UPI0028E5EE44|nr:asparaginase domain-containing protein [Neisseria bacilliformis]
MKKHIFVLYTGGTIGMVPGAHGLRPDSAFAADALAPFSDGLSFDVHTCAPLIDSSAVSLQNWRDWLDILAQKIPRYDGVLLLHGTDTLAYTAALLALALRGLDKPLVLTGAQRPFAAAGSDAPRNLAAAAAALAAGRPQAVIAFNGKLFPAVGSSKCSTESDDGFANPHFGTLDKLPPQRPSEKARTRFSDGLSDGLTVLPIDPQAQVLCLTLIPGFAAQQAADTLRQTSARAAVLQSYGHGNAPDDAAFADAVRAYTARGGLLLNISQVPHGRAAALYAQGNALRQAGAVCGGRCNLETATALLTLAASGGWDRRRLEAELAAAQLV